MPGADRQRTCVCACAATPPDPKRLAAWLGKLRLDGRQLAEISGDINHYIAVLAEDLSAASSYLKLVDALRNVGRAQLRPSAGRDAGWESATRSTKASFATPT